MATRRACPHIRNCEMCVDDCHALHHTIRKQIAQMSARHQYPTRTGTHALTEDAATAQILPDSDSKALEHLSGDVLVTPQENLLSTR